MQETERRDEAICPHLGLAESPFLYSNEATEGHRCYLWMQRDRVHLDHQQAFCLSKLHSRCPWLSISSLNRKPTQRTFTAILAVALFIPITAWGHLRVLSVAALTIWPFIANAARPAILRAIRLAEGCLAYTSSRVATLAPKAPPAAQLLLLLLWRSFSSITKRAIRLAIKGASWAALQTVDLLRRSVAFLWQQTLSLGAQLADLGIAACGVLRAPRQRTNLSSGQNAVSLVNLGKEASVRGDKKIAYQYFSEAVEEQAENEEAWLWRAATTDSSEEAALCLKKALALNPNSGRAQVSLSAFGTDQTIVKQVSPPEVSKPAAPVRREEAGDEETGLSLLEGPLLQQGIAALNAGNEERARKFFLAATEAQPKRQDAWFWSAKTAPDLAELIVCLEKILIINPANERVKADLVWAQQRKRQEELLRTQAPDPAPARRSFLLVQEFRPKPASKALLSVAGGASLTLGALWLGAGLLPLLQNAFAFGEWWGIRALPLLSLPNLTFPETSPFPEFNLFTALPLLVGIIFLLVADGLFSLQRASVYWLIIAVSAAVVLTYVYSAPAEARQITLALSGLAVVAASLGRRGVRPQAWDGYASES